MLDKIKSKLLTKLFIDWVNQEFDVELLEASKVMIQQRQEAVNFLSVKANPPKPIGFKISGNGGLRKV
jgi:hypothetical protein